MVLISMVAAIGENRELGKDNKLLWDIPEDMKRFRQLTKDHAVIMGRKTFESIGHPLPKRTNIVVTRDKDYKSEGVIVIHSLDEALEKAKQIEKEEIFIIGGGQIYQQGLEFADRIYLTIVKGSFEADTYFPDYSEFSKVIEEQRGESNRYSYTFLTLEK